MNARAAYRWNDVLQGKGSLKFFKILKITDLDNDQEVEASHNIVRSASLYFRTCLIAKCSGIIRKESSKISLIPVENVCVW